MKTVISTILLLGSIGIFFGYTNGKYALIKETRTEIERLQEDFLKSKTIIAKRDDLKKTYSSFKSSDLKALDNIIPDNVDNIRLIMDMNSIAQRYGMTLKGIIVNSDQKEKGSINEESSKKLDSLEVSFKVTASYENFVNFLRDLEKSLRIVDVTELTFKSNELGIYDFNVSIRTYWLSK